MADAKHHEVALSFVGEQRHAAETLIRELQHSGLAVFCDDVDNAKLAARIADEDLYEGLERSEFVVLLLSRQYIDRAWDTSERGLMISEVSERASGVMSLCFDDTPIPDDLPSGADFRGADNFALRQVTKEIEERLTSRLGRRDGASSVPDPHMTSLIGEVLWSDYNRGEQFVIGRDDLKFETMWSKSNADSIHVYSDPLSIEGVALASGYTSIGQIMAARYLDYRGRYRTPREGEIIVIRNVNGFYAAVQVLDVKDNTREDDVDELRFRYVIQSDGSDDFSEGAQLKSIKVRGFRSLRQVELYGLRRLIAMIGPNGCGKSNVIRLIEMMQRMLGPRRLTEFVSECGGGDDQLFNGSKVTPSLEAEVTLRVGAADNYDYRFNLNCGADDRLSFTEEGFRLRREDSENNKWEWIDSSRGAFEAGLVAAAERYPPRPDTFRSRVAGNIVHFIGGCRVYQFQDTTKNSGFKRLCDIDEGQELRTDGSNLAAVLLRLQREHRLRYDRICRHIGRVLPSFDRFDLQVVGGKVALRWLYTNSDKSFGAHLTSDGSLRLFSLVTLLNLPTEMLPTVVLLDEPELGLHPAGIALVGGMIKALSTRRQVLVATQSPLLIDAFDIEEMVVLEADSEGSRAHVLAKEGYQDWLDEGYLPSELWQKNVLGGRP